MFDILLFRSFDSGPPFHYGPPLKDDIFIAYWLLGYLAIGFFFTFWPFGGPTYLDLRIIGLLAFF